jgi:serine/threonine protein kinase
VRHNPFKSDVFSLGYCFIYAASLNLNIIYKIRDVNSAITLKNILTKEFEGRYSEKFIDLILKMITFNEDKRIDFIDLERILREDF